MSEYPLPKLTETNVEEVNRYLFRLVEKLVTRDQQLEKELSEMQLEMNEIRNKLSRK